MSVSLVDSTRARARGACASYVRGIDKAHAGDLDMARKGIIVIEHADYHPSKRGEGEDAPLHIFRKEGTRFNQVARNFDVDEREKDDYVGFGNTRRFIAILWHITEYFATCPRVTINMRD